MHKVQTVGHQDRTAFAPRITIEMTGGNTYQGEYGGTELEWGLEAEVDRLRTVVRGNRLAGRPAGIGGLGSAGNSGRGGFGGAVGSGYAVSLKRKEF